jgi:hypothetical protein
MKNGFVRASRSLAWTSALALAVGACGGSKGASSKAAAETGSSPSSPSSGGAESKERSKSQWAKLSDAELRSYLREQARERLTKVQPELELDSLGTYIETPKDAPALAGKSVERLLDLAAVELAGGNLDRAEGLVRLVRERARNRNSAFAGTTLLAEIARRRAEDDQEAQKAIAGVFEALPRARFGPSTVVFRVFQKPKQLSARVQETKSQMLSLETGSSVLFFSQVMPPIVKHRKHFLAAIDTIQKKYDEQPAPAPYDFPTVNLQGAKDAEPVRIAVWDVGTKPDMFEDRLLTNGDEKPNGKDDDGNGLVDDIHGVVDRDGPNTDLLFNPEPSVLEQYSGFFKGIMDLRAGLASTDAAKEVLGLLQSVTSKEKQIELQKNLNAISEWAHGTHVAGIALEGIPQAELAIFRSAWAGEARVYFHRGPTDEELAAERRNVKNVAKFINDHDIQVVNASLGFSKDYLENQLRYQSDKYETQKQIEARAEEVMAHRRESWEYVFDHCPETLFVVAAGNSNRDVVEYGDIPAAMDKPNLLAVGAVNKWGDWATFTNSNPKRVPIFDYGVAVESVIPNGNKVPSSGTSMASPNVANLAAKMLAVNDELTPEEVVELIVETGDPIDEPFGGRIANEKRAIQKARD